MLHAPQGRRRPREARFEKLALFFWFVFRIPIAKSRVELSEGPVSEFEIRPVSASLRNDRQQMPQSLSNAMHYAATPVVPMAPRGWPTEAPISTPGPVPPVRLGGLSAP